MKTITLRGLDDTISEKLKRTAKEEGKSVNQFILDTLKERLAQQATATPDVSDVSSVPTFVELTAPAQTVPGECILELEDAGGAKMRIHLKGFEAPDLAALTQSFRSVES